MKAKITGVTFAKEYESKFGTLYSHKVSYDGKTAFYSSKKKEQNKFIKGQEAEFTEETRNSGKGDYIVIKPVYAGKGQSNYGKALSREQSRYSGFSDSYVKDLLVSGTLKPEMEALDEEYNDVVMMTWKKRALEIFEHMVELDKTLKS